MQDYEKLGAFYLGKTYDLEQGATRDELLLYDSKDLTTHAVCLGMTGSGKTGLCLSLLEEAAIDGIPAIAIDPKGDLGNLFLTFPQLQPADFQPWIDGAEATRKGLTVDQYAANMANFWRDGLATWGQTPDRIQRFRDAVDMAIYTPGSNAGLPLTVLRSFSAPSQAVLDDSDAFRERVTASVSGLLGLLGIDADPVRSREHILLSNILSQAWQQGRGLDIAKLIGEIQSPPFNKVGILDLESFFPTKNRVELAMTLNNLLASPSFASWMEGEPLDVKRLLYTDSGKPRLSVISIAHLSDSERMFFVTILLNEVLAWVRSQPGTSSLRALLYMDEVFGYFPPTANPPSKPPMLTLLKQARAFGLGVVLATQNPVDLDYKGLSNTGTWFLGRLQAERDKARVLEGLEGASAAVGSTFDRQKMEATLAGLSSRVFLMNNVHEDAPVVFQTRWTLSYLRGPLTRQQIATLMADKKQAAERASATAAAAHPSAPAKEAMSRQAAAPQSQPPILPPDVDVFYLQHAGSIGSDAKLVYRPALLGRGKLHFVSAKSKVDTWQPRTLLAQVRDELSDSVWEETVTVNGDTLALEEEPDDGATFASLPSDLINAKNYVAWGKNLKTHFYSTEELTIYQCTELKEHSEAGESEGDFRIRLRQLAHEQRDLNVEKLRKSYASKFDTLQGRIKSAEAAVDREKAQARTATIDTAISIGSTLLGALFGRKVASRTNVTRASTSMRTAGRAAQQRGDISQAQEKVEDLQQELDALEEELNEEVAALEAKFDVEKLVFEELAVRPRKSDIEIAKVALVWTPWCVDSSGIAEPLYDLSE
jgi:hypothetical protein